MIVSYSKKYLQFFSFVLFFVVNISKDDYLWYLFLELVLLELLKCSTLYFIFWMQSNELGNSSTLQVFRFLKSSTPLEKVWLRWLLMGHDWNERDAPAEELAKTQKTNYIRMICGWIGNIFHIWISCKLLNHGYVILPISNQHYIMLKKGKQ